MVSDTTDYTVGGGRERSGIVSQKAGTFAGTSRYMSDRTQRRLICSEDQQRPRAKRPPVWPGQGKSDLPRESPRSPRRRRRDALHVPVLVVGGEPLGRSPAGSAPRPCRLAFSPAFCRPSMPLATTNRSEGIQGSIAAAFRRCRRRLIGTSGRSARNVVNCFH